MNNIKIRDAATVLIVRNAASAPAVLMGQRGQSAAFMPGKFVFPGGAVDGVDAGISLHLPGLCAKRLAENSTCAPNALAAAAIRELWEETGQILGRPAPWTEPPKGWQDFAATGFQPDASHLRFFFRAVTPVGRPRRFDARFFLAPAEALSSDPDDFSRAEDELSHLQWVALAAARKFDLPFITQVVLAELARQLPSLDAPVSVPFFRNDDERHLVDRLGGESPLNHQNQKQN